MLGNSKGMKIAVVYGNLGEWLQNHNVTILDIKFSVTQENKNRYLVLYQ